MNENFAPIILFVYNRLDHASKVVEALLKNECASSSILYVYSDAPKDETAERGVKAVRDYVHKISGFKNINIIERETNWGIEKSEVDAISNVINRYGKAIMIEDDIVVGPDFLRFVNLALEKYCNEKKVFSVTGYSFIENSDVDELPEYAFTQLTSAWGWATWADRWNMFEAKVSLNNMLSLCYKHKRERFDLGFHYSDMMFKQYENNYITWDVLWYWTSFINNGLTLIPTKTMVNNIGMDGSGVHFSNKDTKNRIEDISYTLNDFLLPEIVKEDELVNNKIKKALSNLSKKPKRGIHLLRWNTKEWIKWNYRKIKLWVSKYEI